MILFRAFLAYVLSAVTLNSKDIQVVQRGEVDHPSATSITGKLGLEMYDGMKEVTIETNERVVPGKDPNFWPTNGPTSYPAKRVLVWDFNNQHRETYEKIRGQAAKGETVTLRAAFLIPERSVKLGHIRVALFLE